MLLSGRRMRRTGQVFAGSLVRSHRMCADHKYDLCSMTSPIDDLDARLLAALAETPRAGVMDLARRLRVARGTVQARLDKLSARGIVTGYGPDVALVPL